MKLKTHGDEISILAGRSLLKAEYQSADLGPGTLTLQLEDQVTFDSIEASVRLDPWIADSYEIIEWSACGALILCGSPAIVALTATTLELESAVSLEYDEGETTGVPWFSEIHQPRRFIIATEKRVWCLDERVA